MVPNDSPDWTTNIARPQTAYPGSPFSYGIGLNNITVDVTPDVYTLGITFTPVGSLHNIAVIGIQSGALYLEQEDTLGAVANVQWVPLISALDTSVQIQLMATESGHVSVALMGESAGVITYPANGITSVSIDDATITVPVDQVAATANPWLHPQKYTHVDTGSLANSGTQTLIAGVSGKSIYLHALLLAPIDGGMSVDVFDGTSAGTKLTTFVSALTGTPINTELAPMPPQPFYGVPLTAGLALTAQNTSGATHRWLGYAVYSQA